MPPVANAFRVFVVVVALALVATATETACGTTTADAPEGEDASVDGSNLDHAKCPTAQPASSSACSLPEGTTCSFGKCGTAIASCTRGAWVFGQNPAPPPVCPVAPPSEDDPCGSCWPPDATCTYAESCAEPDATSPRNAAFASCPNLVWNVEIVPCSDAGADVQGDGAPDAD